LNERLHAVSVGKPSERMSNFWMVRFSKTESKPNFGLLHIPIEDPLLPERYGSIYHCQH